MTAPRSPDEAHTSALSLLRRKAQQLRDEAHILGLCGHFSPLRERMRELARCEAAIAAMEPAAPLAELPPDIAKEVDSL